MELCFNCKQTAEIETASGEYVCDDCSYDRCSQCYEGECEVETRNGEYICVDCYSSSIDNAYEHYRD